MSNIIQILDQKPDKKIHLSLSVSKIKCFKQCKKLFKFQYIQKLPKIDTEFTFFGKFLHEILEHFHKERLLGNIDPDNILISTCFKNALVNWGDKLTKVQLTDAKEIISKYLLVLNNNRKNNIEDKIIGIEKNFYIVINDLYLVNGLIDLIKIDHSDNQLHVVDYKSSDLRDKKHSELLFTETKKYDRYKKDIFQLKVYAYVMFIFNPELEKVRCSYSMLRHDFHLITREFKREQIMKIEEDLIKYGKNIEEEKLFRAQPMVLCGWCSYKYLCSEGKQFLGESDGKFGETEW